MKISSGWPWTRGFPRLTFSISLKQFQGFHKDLRGLRENPANLASLGNVVPHLHWHVIARFEWDARWPAPVWAPAQRAVDGAQARLAHPLEEVDALIARSLSASGS